MCVVRRASENVDDVIRLGFMYVSFFRLGYFIVCHLIPLKCCYAYSTDDSLSDKRYFFGLVFPIVNALVLYIVLTTKYEDFFLSNAYFDFDVSSYAFLFALGV